MKTKLSFFIKVLGITTSASVVMLVTAYVYDEFQYDRFHANVNQMYRITTTSRFGGAESHYSRTPLPLYEQLLKLKGVSSAARVFIRGATVSVPADGDKFRETNIWFADSSVASIFCFTKLHGDPATALSDPKGIILTRSAAQRYFGDEDDVIGRSVMLENRILVQVAAVVEDYPSQSSLRFEMIAPFERYYELENPENVDYLRSDWIYTSVFTFVRADADASEESLNLALRNVNAHIPDSRVRDHVHYTAQPMRNIHLYSQFSGEQATQRINYVIVFIIIGVGLLSIGVINYFGLTHAEWVARTKEVAIRKMMGSSRQYLVLQFTVEFVVSLFVLVPVVFALAYLALEPFNIITQKNLATNVLFSFPVASSAIITFVIYMSSAASVVASQSASAGFLPGVRDQRRFRMHPVLTAQFAITFVITCFTLTVFRQLQFVEKKPLGFGKENIVVIPLFSENFNSIIGQVTGDFRGRMNFFEEEVMKHTAIEAITCSSFMPGEGAISALVKTDSLGEDDNVFVRLNSVDYDFLQTYGLRLVEGRNFSRESGTDHQQAFIINEEAMKVLGFRTAMAAIGQNLEAVGKKGVIIGVIENFHFEGLQNQIAPLMLEVAAWKFSAFSVRLKKTSEQEGLAVLKRTWDQVFSESVFNYRFLEEDLIRNYQLEASLGELGRAVSVVTILLSVLGIYASGVQSAQRRLKELTIRKVLGATMVQVIEVFSRPYAWVLLASFILALPMIIYVSEVWLSMFAYRVSLSWSDYVASLVVGTILILIVLSGQFWKVSRTNPVNHLRHE